MNQIKIILNCLATIEASVFRKSRFYTPSIGFVGTLKPSAGFTFGSLAEIREEAARKGWLTLYPEFNEQ